MSWFKLKLKLFCYVQGFACSVGGLGLDGFRTRGGGPGSVKPNDKEEEKMSHCRLFHVK